MLMLLFHVASVLIVIYSWKYLLRIFFKEKNKPGGIAILLLLIGTIASPFILSRL